MTSSLAFMASLANTKANKQLISIITKNIRYGFSKVFYKTDLLEILFYSYKKSEVIRLKKHLLFM